MSDTPDVLAPIGTVWSHPGQAAKERDALCARALKWERGADLLRPDYAQFIRDRVKELRDDLRAIREAPNA